MLEGPVDVVGDIHGQLAAFESLLDKLGYSPDGRHPDGRKLIFVGDLIDRGPDSVGVVDQVMNMVDAGLAQCVLGNHELNLLRNSRKSGNAWYFGEGRYAAAGQRVASSAERARIHDFISELPLALERDDLRVVHASWHADSISRLQALAQDGRGIAGLFAHFYEEANSRLRAAGVMSVFEEEQEAFDELVCYEDKDPYAHWPKPRFLPGYAAVNETRQMHNPVAVLTSGQEAAATSTYPAGGKFRFVDRVAWWDDYLDSQTTIVGHYWRLYDPGIADKPRVSADSLFQGAGPADWLGARKNVYCVDFSVGGRARGYPDDVCRLAAIRWPEATVVFDDGEVLETQPGD